MSDHPGPCYGCGACPLCADNDDYEFKAEQAKAEWADDRDGYCTCHPDQRGRTADCGIAAHRSATIPVPKSQASLRDRIAAKNLPYCTWCGDTAGHPGECPHLVRAKRLAGGR